MALFLRLFIETTRKIIIECDNAGKGGVYELCKTFNFFFKLGNWHFETAWNYHIKYKICLMLC